MKLSKNIKEWNLWAVVSQIEVGSKFLFRLECEKTFNWNSFREQAFVEMRSNQILIETHPIFNSASNKSIDVSQVSTEITKF